jgi:23S rRNA (uracil1939-C5)-methyltransferase
MGRRRRRQRLPQGEFEAEISSAEHDGRGVARIDGKVTFIHGALPGELVMFRYLNQRRSHDEGQVVSIVRPSAQRYDARCAQYGVCGGCSLQHLEPSAQIEVKQTVLLDNLRQIGQVEPENVLPPIVNDSPWGYRRKARLGVKDVARKGKVLVGFRERGSSYVADVATCHVLHPRVGGILPQLSALIGSLSISRRLPQIEVAMDDERCVLILRVLDPLSAADEQLLNDFQGRYDVVFYLQPGGPETVKPLNVEVDLHYELPAYDLTLGFSPGDFTQVNSEINRRMIERALQLLELAPTDRVLDLFCGIGNFTLPIARCAASVVGVEGDAGLVARARRNAQRNDLFNAEFVTADLYAELQSEPWAQRRFDKALLDPPRSGAREVLPTLAEVGVQRICYVSCYPATLARDAGELVRRHGYRLLNAGVMDMFPHTAHVESIALFERH